MGVLAGHLAEHRQELQQLERAMSHLKGLMPLSTTRMHETQPNHTP
jgi:hypothetical protein